MQALMHILTRSRSIPGRSRRQALSHSGQPTEPSMSYAWVYCQQLRLILCLERHDAWYCHVREPDEAGDHMILHRFRMLSLVAAAAVLSLLAACGDAAPRAESSPPPIRSMTSPTTPVDDLVLEVGGSFGDQPSLTDGPMTRRQAASEAIDRGQTDGAAPEAETSIHVTSYAEYSEALDGVVGRQLPPLASVYVVHVEAAFPAEALPRPAGVEPPVEGWPSYVVAFDPRTGLASLTPGPPPR